MFTASARQSPDDLHTFTVKTTERSKPAVDLQKHTHAQISVSDSHQNVLHIATTTRVYAHIQTERKRESNVSQEDKNEFLN